MDCVPCEKKILNQAALTRLHFLAAAAHIYLAFGVLHGVNLVNNKCISRGKLKQALRLHGSPFDHAKYQYMSRITEPQLGTGLILMTHMFLSRNDCHFMWVCISYTLNLATQYQHLPATIPALNTEYHHKIHIFRIILFITAKLKPWLATGTKTIEAGSGFQTAEARTIGAVVSASTITVPITGISKTLARARLKICPSPVQPKLTTLIKNQI